MEKEKKQLLYLTGFMGSGKSSIAPILANTLGFNSIDMDAEIEKITGMRVSEIFFEHGELFFRDVENKLLLEICRQRHCVVSLGGGTITNEHNLRIIKTTGVLVYLKVDAEHIFRRLKFKKNRPLLIAKDGTILPDNELRIRISTLLDAREPFYSQSDVVISTNELHIGSTVDEIVRCTKRLIDINNTDAENHR